MDFLARITPVSAALLCFSIAEKAFLFKEHEGSSFEINPYNHNFL